MIIYLLGLFAVVSAGSNTDNKESYKNQFRTGHAGKHNAKRDNTNFSSEYCTDPRTMKKHPAYTEWADAYSCTRHRCQPGGRNLAIYTVGCKRVEAPESAIECEEVVEDTNMQFPFCCTRLRCLVVVRGEVWTRVLGQPWEVLPAAPWSHMYKMKKPPPADSTFLPKTVDQGPIYELTDNESDQNNHEKVLLRTGKKAVTDNNEYNEVPPPTEIRAEPLPSPDIVIALTTDEGKESTQSERKKSESSRHSKRRKANALPPAKYFEAEEKEHQGETLNLDLEEKEVPVTTEKPQEPIEEETEKYFNVNSYPVTQKSTHKSHSHDKTHTPISWTEIPLSQWNEPKEQREDQEPRANDHNTNDYQPQEPQLPENREPKHEALQIAPKKELGDKPSNLQALVDAIGTRMRDIENVVQKMSDKVHQVKATTEGSDEKRASAERDGSHKRYKDVKRPSTEAENYKRVKRPSTEVENYKRFTVDRASKYLHSSTESTTEKPLFIEDSKLTGYFSDASNSVLRRNGPHKAPKEPPPTYMAPVAETRRKSVHIAVPETSDDEKKHKKHTHKKHRNKSSRSHKKHSRPKEDRRKHFNKLSSGEAEKNAVSSDDISDLGQ